MVWNIKIIKILFDYFLAKSQKQIANSQFIVFINP